MGAMEICKTKSEVNLGYVKLDVLDSCIVRSTYAEDTTLDVARAHAVNKAIGEMTDGKAMLQMFVACPGLDVEKDVREWGVTEEANKYTIASAVVCNSLAHRLLGNFFIKVQKPLRPTKMFSSEEEAIVWLKSFLN